KCILTDVVSAYDSCISTDRSTLANMCSGILIAPVNCTSRIYDVCKNHGRTQKHVIITGHTSIDRHIVLHLNIFSQNDVWRDHDILSYITILTYLTARHDVGEVPDFDTSCYFSSVVNDGTIVHEIIILHRYKIFGYG